MRVTCAQKRERKALEIRMIEHCTDELLADAAPAKFRQDEDISQVSKCRPVRHGARKARQLVATVGAET